MKYPDKKITAYLLTLLLSTTAQASHNHQRPDSHAPAGIMGDHIMDKDEVMLSYRYMAMTMDGNLNGTNSIPTPLPGFMVSPLNMDMKMHMSGIMYAPTEKLTLSLMTSILSLSMDHRVNMNDVEFTTESRGIGDINIATIYQLAGTSDTNLLLNFSLGIPSGSIDEKDITPASNGVPVQLPYPMQTGSGSYSITPGLTYSHTYTTWSWGAQGLYKYYVDTNNNGYKLGDRIDISAWVAKNLNHSFSLSFRLNALDRGNIEGADKKLSPAPTLPTKKPELRGGSRIDALIGVNYVAHELNEIRFSMEIGTPIYQNLNGPQLETDLLFTLGAQYVF